MLKALETMQSIYHYILADQSCRLMLALCLICILMLLLAPKAQKNKTLSKEELQAIAGDDLISTHLDLAKAYIEMEQKDIAKEMLNSILKQGNQLQKQAAKDLMKVL